MAMVVGTDRVYFNQILPMTEIFPMIMSYYVCSTDEIYPFKEYNKDIEVVCYAICFIKSQEELSYFLSILYSSLF